MDAGFVHGMWTAALLAVFAAIVAWAWSGRRKRDFEEAARLPLEEDAEDGADRVSDRGSARNFHRSECSPQEENGTDPHPQGARHG